MNIGTEDDVKSLAVFMSNNERRVKKLHLEFSKNYDDSTITPSEGLMQDYGLKLREKQSCGLESISVLSLANFTFGYNQEIYLQFIQIFNICGLISLSLDACSEASRLLHSMAATSTRTTLQHLQLIISESIDCNISSKLSVPDLSQYLLSFQGLRSIYVMICMGSHSSKSFKDYVPGIVNHSATLRRLVWHERKSTRGEDLWDTEDMTWKYVDDFVYLSAIPEIDPLFGSTLDCFGLSTHPSFLAYMNIPQFLLDSPCLRILHIRCSMEQRPEGTRAHFMNLLQQYTDDLLAELLDEEEDDNIISYEDSINETHHRFGFQNFYNDDDSSEESIPGYDLATALFDLAGTFFGEDGPPNFDILAWGDFSNRLYKGHPALESNIILARNATEVPGPAFRVIELAEVEDFTTVDRPQDFLKACDAQFGSVADFPGRSSAKRS